MLLRQDDIGGRNEFVNTRPLLRNEVRSSGGSRTYISWKLSSLKATTLFASDTICAFEVVTKEWDLDWRDLVEAQCTFLDAIIALYDISDKAETQAHYLPQFDESLLTDAHRNLTDLAAVQRDLW